MKIVTAAQGTQDWFNARVGCLTASRMSDALATTKTGESEKRKKLKYDLLAERLMGRKVEVQQTAAMKWGIENEPIARSFYEAKRSVQVDVPGFILHDTVESYGCSPDGFVGDDGMIEIKCPQAATHMKYLLEPQAFLDDYIPQMACQLIICGRKWNDGISYHPHFGIDTRMLVVRYEPTDDELQNHFDKAVLFLKELDELQASIYLKLKG